MARARRAWPDVVAAVLVGAAVFAFFGRAFLNYDSFYALVWGNELAHGRLPTYDVPVAPTPHPLATLIGIVISPFGDAAETIFLALVLFAIGLLVVGIFRLGQSLYSVPVGLFAALIVVTRVPLLNYGIRGYVDLPTIALVVWAAVLEARHPRRGAPVLLLLALAGLLRPEMWGFSVAYWIWCATDPIREDRLRLALIALSAPALWCLTDLLIQGDPLWSLHGTSDLAAQLDRKTGLRNEVTILPRRLGEILRLPELVSATIGAVAGLIYMRRQTLLPLSIAVLNGLAFTAFAIAKLPLLGRYLFLSSTMLAILAALACLGWTALPQKPRTRRLVWTTGGTVLLLAIAVLFPVQQVDRLRDLRTDIRNRYQVDADLRQLVQQPAARQRIDACGPVYLPNHRPVPQTAFWTGKRPATVQAIGPAPVSDGVYISPIDMDVEKLSILDPKDPAKLGTEVPSPAHGPPGYEEVARNRSWVLFAGDCAG